MKYAYILLLIIFMLSACKYESLDSENYASYPPREWKEISAFRGAEKIYLNCYAQGDSLTVTGVFYIGFIREKDSIFNGAAYSNVQQSVFQKNAFSRYIYALKSSTSDYFSIKRASDIWCNNRSCATLNVYGKIPTDLHTFNFEYDIGAFNQNSSFLTSYLTKQNPNQMRFLFFKTKPENPWAYDEGLIDTPSIKYIKLPIEESILVKRIQAFGQNFYISTNKNSYLIREDGSFNLILNQSTKSFFEYKNNVYADVGNVIYISKDNGKTWTTVVNGLDAEDFRQYSVVADRLICYHKEDKIDEIIQPDLKFEFKPLDNKELVNKRITSVTEFKKNVFVTTFNGLFKKPVSDFFR
jgi:hypothetical protein